MEVADSQGNGHGLWHGWDFLHGKGREISQWKSEGVGGRLHIFSDTIDSNRT